MNSATSTTTALDGLELEGENEPSRENVPEAQVSLYHCIILFRLIAGLFPLNGKFDFHCQDQMAVEYQERTEDGWDLLNPFAFEIIPYRTW